MSLRSMATMRLRQGSSIVELLLIMVLLSIVISGLISLLLLWRGRTERWHSQWRDLREQDRLSAALSEDLTAPHDVQVGRKSLVIVSSRRHSRQVEYWIFDDVIVRLERSGDENAVRRESFVLGAGRRLVWSLQRRQAYSTVRLEDERRPDASLPESRTFVGPTVSWRNSS